MGGVPRSEATGDMQFPQHQRGAMGRRVAAGLPCKRPMGTCNPHQSMVNGRIWLSRPEAGA